MFFFSVEYLENVRKFNETVEAAARASLKSVKQEMQSAGKSNFFQILIDPEEIELISTNID